MTQRLDWLGPTSSAPPISSAEKHVIEREPQPLGKQVPQPGRRAFGQSRLTQPHDKTTNKHRSIKQ